jgi:hypothetical protein
MTRSLRLATLSLLFLLVTLLAPTGSAADPAMLRMAAPGSNFVIGIDVQALASSPLAQEALMKAQQEHPEWESKLKALGPNPLSRISEVVIIGDIQAAKDDSEGLVLVRGDFSDRAWISEICKAGCTTDQYKGFTMQGMESADKPGAFVQLDSQYVALGPPHQIRGVIDRRVSGFASRFAAESSTWTTTTSGHHFWIAAKGPFDMPEASAAPMGMSTLGNLAAFGMGLTLGTDLNMAMELRSLSNAESVTLYQTLQGLLMMFSASAEQDPDAAEFFRNLKIEQGAETVTASLRLPGHVLQRMAANKLGSASTVSVSSVDEQPTTPPRRQRPRSGVIRINGLEGGPVEVQSQPQ